MCSATAVFLHVAEIYYAATDEYFEGVHDLWDQHHYSRRWMPTEIGPLDQPMSGFARLLPLAAQAAVTPGSSVMSLAHEQTPDIAALAEELAADQTLDRIRTAGGSVTEVLTELWPRLPR